MEKKTNASFDQIGFVYTTRASRGSNLNFGFNYTKGKNFDFLLNASGKLGNGSQNNQSYLKHVLGSENYGGFDVRKKMMHISALPLHKLILYHGHGIN